MLRSTVTAGALAGAWAGAWAGAFDLALATVLDGSGPSWLGLGSAPLVALVLGAAAGAAFGALVGGVTRGDARRSGADNDPATIERVAGVVLTLGLAGSLAVQLFVRAPLVESRTARLVGAAVIALAVVASHRWIATRLGRLLRTPGRHAAAFAALLVIAGAPAALRWWTPRTRATPWQPSPARPAPTEASTPPKLLVLGLDGARWETLDPLIAAGRLPHLAGLVARGRRGVLHCEGDSASPVAWTTVLSGQPPDVHGITHWEVAISTRRRVPALWNILDGLGWRTCTTNVPGSFPADELAHGVMVAGFPLPQVRGRNRGWIVGADRVDPDGPLCGELTGSDGDRARLADSSERGRALGRASPFELLRRVAPGPTKAFVTAITMAPGLGLSFELELEEPDTATWSPWMAVDVDGEACVVRLRGLRPDESGTAGAGLFVTPLFRTRPPGLTYPAALVDVLHQGAGPYIAEGVGWSIFREPSVLAALEEHTLELAATRATATEELLRRGSWDALVHVYTVTDRIQHPFWKFHDPAAYATSADQAPTPDQVERFGGAVARVYEAVDASIGRLLEHADETTLVVIVSDHGAQSGAHALVPTAGPHHPDGIYLAAGPTIPAATTELGPRLEQVDLVPLLLDHLGLPRAEDLPGRVPEALAPRGADGAPLRLPDPVATYADDGARSVGRSSEDVLEQIRSLGYVR